MWSSLTFAPIIVNTGRGLKSSMEIEPQLKHFWYPVEFSKTLQKDTLVPLELFDETWVLFRDENGKPACVNDEVREERQWRV